MDTLHSSVINLSDVPTARALEIASTAMPIRIRISEVITCSPNGPISIPVRIIPDDQPKLMAIDTLETLVSHRMANKAEFRYLAKIHRILSSR